MRELSHTEDVANCNASLHGALECMANTGLVKSMDCNFKSVFETEGQASKALAARCQQKRQAESRLPVPLHVSLEQSNSKAQLASRPSFVPFFPIRDTGVCLMPNLEKRARQSACVCTERGWQNRWPQKDPRCHLHHTRSRGYIRVLIILYIALLLGIIVCIFAIVEEVSKNNPYFTLFSPELGAREPAQS